MVANEVSPKHLVVSAEAAAVAVAVDRLITALGVPVDALRKVCCKAKTGLQRYQAEQMAAAGRREHVRIYGRVWSNVLKRVDGVR